MLTCVLPDFRLATSYPCNASPSSKLGPGGASANKWRAQTVLPGNILQETEWVFTEDGICLGVDTNYTFSTFSTTNPTRADNATPLVALVRPPQHPLRSFGMRPPPPFHSNVEHKHITFNDIVAPAPSQAFEVPAGLSCTKMTDSLKMFRACQAAAAGAAGAADAAGAGAVPGASASASDVATL